MDFIVLLGCVGFIAAAAGFHYVHRIEDGDDKHNLH